jgi:DNA-binding response OmpR family regulator
MTSFQRIRQRYSAYLRHMRILVIEDERKVASFIRRGLEEERYIVETAADGETGLDLALHNHFDAIVLDVMLPKLDGFGVLATLRDAGVATPILMLTARSTTDDRVQGLDLGADDYLAKPFHFEELAARLRSILRRSSSEKTTKLSCGDLTLDMVTHFAFRDDKEIELTTKEYALLEYLMRNKDRILSRSMIMQHVWKHNFDPESNIIDVYIKRLRNKIERPGHPQLIQSIRGVGYRMREASINEPDDEQEA